jgi:L-fuculose-phosphate aldolase
MRRRSKAALSEEIVAAALYMTRSGLSPGRSGNISIRWKDGMLITASGVAPEAMTPATDVVFVGGGEELDLTAKQPSTEWHFHQAIYRARKDIGGIVHCHSRFATALACLHKPIPAFHYMVAKAGGSEIPLAQYATFGTPELAKYAAEALSQCKACLLANHGQIAIGEMLNDALELAEEVESLAAQYVAALSIGQPALLDDEEMKRVLSKFKNYGKPTATD